jgi:hypothetical protein
VAVLITKQDSNFSDSNNFYEVETFNLGLSAAVNGSALTLATARNINVTFAHAGNVQGVVLCLSTTAMTSRAIHVALEEYQAITSVDYTTDTFTKNSHGLLDNDIVTFSTTGTLPGGMSTTTRYYVVSSATNTFKISTTLGGSALNLTSNGTGTHTVGVQRAYHSATVAEITNGDNIQTGTYKHRGTYITPITFDAPYAVDTTMGKWRLKIMHGSGSGTWNAFSSDLVTPTNISYAIWCDNIKSFSTGNDIIIVKNYLTIDQNVTLSSTTASGDATNTTSVWICSNVQNMDRYDVAYLRWSKTPAASYSFSYPGSIFMALGGGIEIGNENSTTVTISNANPGVVTWIDHGMVANQMVRFTSTGTLPDGLSASQGFYYYVKNVINSYSFTLSATPGGAEIDTTGTQSGIHTVYYGAIPTAQRAIWYQSEATSSSIGAIHSPSLNASYTPQHGSTFIVCGQKPKFEYTTLTAQADIGASSLTVADAVDWVNGDQIVIGKQDVLGQGDTTVYTVSSVVGNTINLTGTIASYNRLIGATVMRLDNHGVKMYSGYGYKFNYLFNPANLILQGADLYNFSIYQAGVNYYYLLASLLTAYRSKHLFNNLVCPATYNASNAILGYYLPPPDGAEMTKTYYWRLAPYQYLYYRSSSGFTSGYFDVHDNRILSKYTQLTNYVTGGNGSLNAKWRNYNNSWENGSAGYAQMILHGLSCEHYNNLYWGGAGVAVGQFVNPVKLQNNTYSKCTYGLNFLANVTVNCVESDSIFSSNTYDVGFADSALISYVLNSPTGTLTFDETYLADTVVGTRLSVQSENDTTDIDYTINTFGKLVKTGTGLADTTCRTAGGFALRMEPLSGTEQATFSTVGQPTGNIQNKTMSINVWVKINNANYYAGTDYQLPRLTVTYDVDQTASCTAASHTDWQLLPVPITPKTTTGGITITLSGMTDATSTDRYIYWDDADVQLPSGHSFNSGSLDNWLYGLPITPFYANSISPLSFFTANTSVDYGDGTIGELLKMTEKKVDDNTIIPGLL